MSIYDFRGYDKVRLSYKELEIVLNCGKRDWIAALENQKTVYLITDKENGKMYVRSATSGYGMLLQRWRCYIANGPGGKKHYRLEYLAITVTKEKYLII